MDSAFRITIMQMLRSRDLHKNTEEEAGLVWPVWLVQFWLYHILAAFTFSQVTQIMLVPGLWTAGWIVTLVIKISGCRKDLETSLKTGSFLHEKEPGYKVMETLLL